MIGEPSRRLPGRRLRARRRATSRATSAARGARLTSRERARPRVISAARINLNVAPQAARDGARRRRRAGSSSSPPRARRSCRTRTRGSSAGSSPGASCVVVPTPRTRRSTTYRELLADPGAAEELGRRARERVLDEHTYAQRARRLLDLRRRPGRGRVSELDRPGGHDPAGAPRVAAPRRDRPGAQRGGARSARVIRRDPRLRRRARDRRRSTTARPTAPPRRARRRRAASCSLPFNLGIGGAVQTGFQLAERAGFDLVVRARRRRPARPASELPKLLEPILDDGADIVVGSRFAGDGRLPLVVRAPARDPALRRVVSLLVAPAGDRHDLRLPGRATGTGSRCSPRDYPHDYPEVEATVMVFKHRLRLAEVPVRDARARGRRRRRSARSRSVYYMVKVLLARLRRRSFAALTSTPLEEEDRMTPLASRSPASLASLSCSASSSRADPQPPAARALRAAVARSPGSCCSRSRPGAAG